MRYFYCCLLFCLLSITVISQTGGTIAPANDSASARPMNIRIRCHATPGLDAPPLYIIDGIVADSADVRKLDVNDVESIDILKQATASALYGCRAARGVIIITTKSAGLQKFLVEDSESGESLPGATITFISSKNGKDSLRFLADSKGYVKTKDLKKGSAYNVVISSVGYKTLSAIYNESAAGINQQYRLSRDIKQTAEVVVLSYTGCRLRRLTACGLVSQYLAPLTAGPVVESSAGKLFTRVYPNPSARGNAVKLEINLQDTKPLQVRITNLSGAALRSVTHHPVKGLNRVEIPTESQWAAGMYFVQVVDEKGKLLKQDKLLIQ